MQPHCFDLPFDLAVVTLTYKISPGLYLRKLLRVGKCYLVGTLVGDCRCATYWCDPDLTFDLPIVTLRFETLSRLYL